MYDTEEMKIKRLGYAKTAIAQESIKLCRRIIGQITREASRIMDQSPILGEMSSIQEVEDILWKHFRAELDNVAEAIRVGKLENEALGRKD